jgi:hypothetical protein
VIRTRVVSSTTLRRTGSEIRHRRGTGGSSRTQRFERSRRRCTDCDRRHCDQANDRWRREIERHRLMIHANDIDRQSAFTAGSRPSFLGPSRRAQHVAAIIHLRRTSVHRIDPGKGRVLRKIAAYSQASSTVDSLFEAITSSLPKSPDPNVLHTSPIQDIVNLIGKRSKPISLHGQG